MKISDYNLIIFILENSYENYKLQENPDWNKWFFSISRIFHHKIPIKLLLGMKRKNNNEINMLCDKELGKIKLRKKEKEEKKQNEYNNWLLRRNIGNETTKKRIEQEKERTQKERKEKIKDSWNIVHENYIKEMTPVWKDNFEKILKEREYQYNEYFSGRNRLQEVL